MSGEYVICVYRPKKVEGDEFKKSLDEHLDVLDRGGYLASRQHLVLQSEKDGTVLELLEWKSRDAAGRAHNDPNVQKIWGQLSEVAELISLNDLAEAEETFPHFAPFDHNSG